MLVGESILFLDSHCFLQSLDMSLKLLVSLAVSALLLDFESPQILDLLLFLIQQLLFVFGLPLTPLLLSLYFVELFIQLLYQFILLLDLRV